MEDELLGGKQDWFTGRLSGKLEGNYADILNSNNAENFTIGKFDDYLKNPEIKDYYKSKFGDKYKDVLQQDVIVAQKDYQNFREGNFNKYGFSQTVLGPGMGSVSEGGKYKEVSSLPSFYITKPRLDQAFVTASGNVTAGLNIDARKFDANSDIYFDDKGNEYKLPTKGEVIKDYNPIKVAWFNTSTNPNAGPLDIINTGIKYLQSAFTDDKKSGMAYMINNPNYKIDGKLITGWVYQEGDLGRARKAGYVAVTEGNYLKHAHQTPVSIWDAYHGDFDVKADTFDFLGRTLNNSVNALPGMFYTAGSAVDGLFNGNKALDRWEKELMSNRMNEISLSKRSQEAGFLGNWDQTAGLVTDVLAQVLTGRAIGGAAFKVTGLALKGANLFKTTALTGAQISTKAATVAKWSSLGAMSMYGAKDAYHSALANGFSNREASVLFLGTFGALMGANKYINVLDDVWENKQATKILGEMIGKDVAANKEVFKTLTKETAEELAGATTEEAKKKVMGAYMSKVVNVLGLPFKLSKKGLDKIVGAGKGLATSEGAIAKIGGGVISEGTEESLEFLGEEGVKNIFETVKLITDYTAEDNMEGKMTTMYDPGYWSDFGSGLLQSAVAGGIGGGLMNTKVARRLMNMDDGSTKLKDNLVSVVENGLGDKYLDMLKAKRDAGELGDTELSTVLDPVSQTYVPVKDAPEGSTSMNEAMYQVLSQQYQYVNKVLGQLGSKSLIDKFKKDYPDVLYNTSLAKDINALHKEYISIVLDNNIDEQSRPTENLYISPKDTTEQVQEKVAKYAGAANISEDVAKRILEIHSEIKNIQTGVSVKKYLSQAITQDNILNPNNNVDVNLQDFKDHFGENVFYNLMNSSKEDFVGKIKSIEENLKKQEANDKLVDSLKDDLSNIDDLLPLLNEVGLFVSQKSKDKLTNLLTDPKAADSFLSKMKESFIKEAKDLYTEDYVKNSLAYATIEPTLNEQQRKNYIDYTVNFLNSFAENQANKINNISDALNYRLFDFSKAKNINSEIDAFISGTEEYIEPSETIKDDTLTSEDIKNEAIKIAKFSAASQKPETINYSLESFIPELNALNTFNKLSNAFLNAKEINKEDEYAESLIDSLIKGFEGDKDSVNNSSSLSQSISNLEAVAEKSNNIDPFREVINSNSALYQAKARLAQTNTLIDSIYKNFIALDQGDGTLQFFLNGLKGSNNGLISDFYHIISDIVNNTETLDKETLNDLNLIFPDIQLKSEEFLKLYQKGAKRNKKEQEAFDDILKNNFGAIVKAKRNLEDLVRRAQVLANKAAQGAELVEDADMHRQTMLDEMERDEKVISSLINTLEAVDPSIASLDLIIDYKKQLIVNTVGRFSDDENIIKSFNLLENVKKHLSSLSLDVKDQVLKNYLEAEAIIDGSLSTENTVLYRERYRRAIVFLKLDSYNYYKNCLILQKENPELFGPSTGEQDLAIMSLVAHLTTDAAFTYTALTEPQRQNNLHNATVLLGIQGSGKSSYVLSTALKIAQRMKGLDDSAKNVVVASNQPEQVEILKKETTKFNVKVADKNIVSEQVDGKLKPKTLIDQLKDPNNFAGIDTIIYDEVTYVEYDELTPSRKDLPLDKKSDLSQILQLVEKINLLRIASNKPLLKVILMGDDKQNGYRAENGSPRNIGTADSFYKSPKLMTNLRSSIKSLNAYVRSVILNLDKNDKFFDTVDRPYNIDKLESTYGFIQNYTGFYGGLRLETVKVENRQSNFDDDFFDHVKDKIEEHLAAGEEKFTLGVILPNMEDFKQIDKDSKLGKLISNYPNNIKATTHDTVQGQEFDYVFSIVTSKDIGDGRKNWSNNGRAMEQAAGIKLGTTIGRARYFAYIVNESNRDFSSKVVSDIRMTDNSIKKALVDKYLELKEKMYSSILEGEDVTAIGTIEAIITATPEPISETIDPEEAERLKDEELAKELWFSTASKFVKNIKIGDVISFTSQRGIEKFGTVTEVSADGTMLKYKIKDTVVEDIISIDKNNQIFHSNIYKGTEVDLKHIPAENINNEEAEPITAPTIEEAREMVSADDLNDILNKMSRSEFDDLLIFVKRLVSKDPSITSEEDLEKLKQYSSVYDTLKSIERNRKDALNNYTTNQEILDLQIKAIFTYLSSPKDADALSLLQSKTTEGNPVFSEQDYSNFTQAEAREELDKIANEVEWDSNSPVDGKSYSEIYVSLNQPFDEEIKKLRPELDIIEEITNEDNNVEPFTQPEEKIISDVPVEEQTFIVKAAEENFAEGNISEADLNAEKDKLTSSIEQRDAIQDETELSQEEFIDEVNKIYGPNFTEAFTNEFFEGIVDEESADKKPAKEEKTNFVKRLEEKGLDTFYPNYMPTTDRKEILKTNKAKELFAGMVNISKKYVNKIFGIEEQEKADALSTSDYIAKQLQALGLSKEISTNEFKYEMTIFHQKEETEVGYSTHILITAVHKNSGVRVQIGRILYDFLNADTKQLYNDFFNNLNKEQNWDSKKIYTELNNPFTIDVPFEALSLENVTPGGIEPANLNTPYNEDFKVILKENHPGLKISPVMISTATTIEKEGKLIENEFRGEGFILYSFGDKINLDNEIDLANILNKGLALADPNLNHTFANGIGIIRLDNRHLLLKQLIDELKSTSITREQITKSINVPKLQRDFSSLMVNLLASNPNLMNKFPTDTQEAIQRYKQQSVYRTFQASDNSKPEDKNIYDGKHLTRNIMSMTTEDKAAQQMLNNFLEAMFINPIDSLNGSRGLILGRPETTVNENGETEIVYNTAIDRVSRKPYSYPKIQKDSDNFILKLLPLITDSIPNQRPNSQFNLENFLFLLNDFVENSSEADNVKAKFYELFDDILKSTISGTLNKGVIIRPRIEKSPLTENLLFARAAIDMGQDSMSYYNIKVDYLSFPQLIVDRSRLMNSITEDQNQKLIEEENIASNISQIDENDNRLIEIEQELNNLTLDKTTKKEYLEELNNLDGQVTNISLREKLITRLKAIKETKVAKPLNKATISNMQLHSLENEQAKNLISSIDSDKNIFLGVTETEQYIQELEDLKSEVSSEDAILLDNKIKELTDHLNALKTPEKLSEYINSLFDKDLFNTGSIKTLGLNIDSNTDLGLKSSEITKTKKADIERRRQEKYNTQYNALVAGQVLDNQGDPVYEEDKGIGANGLSTLTDKKYGHGHIRTSGLDSLKVLESLLEGSDFSGMFGQIGIGDYSTWESGKFIIVSNNINPVTNNKLNLNEIEVILNAGLSPFAQELANKYPNVVFKDFNGKKYNAELAALNKTIYNNVDTSLSYKLLFLAYHQAKANNLKTEQEQIKNVIIDKANNLIPDTYQGRDLSEEEILAIQNATTEPNLSDNIEDEALQNTINSTLDSIKNISSLRIESPSDISKNRVLLEEKVSELNKIAENVTDAGQKSKLLEDIAEARNNAIASLDEQENANKPSESDRLFPGELSTIDEDQKSIIIDLMSQYAEDYIKYLNGDLTLNEKSLENIEDIISLESNGISDDTLDKISNYRNKCN